MIKKRKLICILVILLFALIESAFETWITEKRYHSPAGSSANGMGFDGKYIWHADNGAPGVLYQINPKNGNVVKTLYLDLPNSGSRRPDPGDIAWHKGSIWMVEENAVNSLPPQTYRIYKIAPSNGEVLQVIDIQVPSEFSGQMEGMASDGKVLYISFGGKYILKYNPATNEILNSLTLSWANQQYYVDGLAFAWGHLFGSVNTPASIVEFDPKTGRKLSDFRAPAGTGYGPEGLTFDGMNIWYAEYYSQTLFKIRLLDGYFR
jgi:streptogramin lyase